MGYQQWREGPLAREGGVMAVNSTACCSSTQKGVSVGQRQSGAEADGLCCCVHCVDHGHAHSLVSFFALIKPVFVEPSTVGTTRLSALRESPVCTMDCQPARILISRCAVPAGQLVLPQRCAVHSAPNSLGLCCLAVWLCVWTLCAWCVWPHCVVCCTVNPLGMQTRLLHILCCTF